MYTNSSRFYAIADTSVQEGWEDIEAACSEAKGQQFPQPAGRKYEFSKNMKHYVHIFVDVCFSLTFLLVQVLD